MSFFSFVRRITGRATRQDLVLLVLRRRNDSLYRRYQEFVSQSSAIIYEMEESCFPYLRAAELLQALALEENQHVAEDVRELERKRRLSFFMKANQDKLTQTHARVDKEARELSHELLQSRRKINQAFARAMQLRKTANRREVLHRLRRTEKLLHLMSLRVETQHQHMSQLTQISQEELSRFEPFFKDYPAFKLKIA